jgi:hypothetical protein
MSRQLSASGSNCIRFFLANRGIPLPLGWALSKGAAGEMQDQIWDNSLVPSNPDAEGRTGPAECLMGALIWRIDLIVRLIQTTCKQGFSRTGDDGL